MKKPIADGKPWHSGVEPMPSGNDSIMVVAKGTIHFGSAYQVSQFLDGRTIIAWCYEKDFMLWFSD
jgi:hypothetical protein